LQLLPLPLKIKQFKGKCCNELAQSLAELSKLNTALPDFGLCGWEGLLIKKGTFLRKIIFYSVWAWVLCKNSL
jgi:hypothetical protein